MCYSEGTVTRLATLRGVSIGSGNTTRVIRFDYFITYSNYIGCKKGYVIYVDYCIVM